MDTAFSIIFGLIFGLILGALIADKYYKAGYEDGKNNKPYYSRITNKMDKK